MPCKICSKCKTEKQVNGFAVNKKSKDGLRSWCKACCCFWAKENRIKNPDKLKEQKRRFYNNNKDNILLKNKTWKEQNKEKKADSDSIWRAKNKDRIIELQRLWIKANPEKHKENCRRNDLKYRSTIMGRLHQRMSSAIGKVLRGRKQGRRWEDLVNYTPQQLKRHIEKKFIPGMSWDNMGEWHIDHIVPKCVFNFKNVEDTDFKRCWALKNLQPLWAEENFKKHTGLGKPFQPSLGAGF